MTLTFQDKPVESSAVLLLICFSSLEVKSETFIELLNSNAIWGKTHTHTHSLTQILIQKLFNVQKKRPKQNGINIKNKIQMNKSQLNKMAKIKENVHINV